MISLLFIAQSFAADECDSKIPSEIFALKISEAKERLEKKDSQQFMLQVDALNDYVPCLIQPITSEQAAGYHLYTGIQFFLRQNESSAQLHFSAAKATNHPVSIPTSIFPEGHQLHSSFNKAPGLMNTETISGSEQSVFYFDGTQSNERPLYRPSIFQQLEGDELKMSMLLQPGDKLACSSCVVPESLLPQNQASLTSEPSVVEPEIVPVTTQPAVESPKSKKPSIMLIGAGGAAAFAASGFLLYRSTGLQLNTALGEVKNQDLDLSYDDIQSLNNRNKIGKTTFILSSAATLGFGVTWIIK